MTNSAKIQKLIENILSFKPKGLVTCQLSLRLDDINTVLLPTNDLLEPLFQATVLKFGNLLGGWKLATKNYLLGKKKQ